MPCQTSTGADSRVQSAHKQKWRVAPFVVTTVVHTVCFLLLDKYAHELRSLAAADVQPFLLHAIRSRARSVEACV